MARNIKEILKSLDSPKEVNFAGEDKSFITDEEQHIKLKQQFIHDEEKWVPMTPHELLDVKVGYFLNDQIRLLLKFEYKKDILYVVNKRVDYDSMKLKYPKALVIDVCQLLKLWTGHISFEDNTDPIFRVIPQFLFVEKFIPGVKLVSC